MNILFITQLYPLSNDSRNSFALHYFVKEWAKNHNVQVIRPYLPKEMEKPPTSNKITIDNINVDIVKPIWIPGLKISLINKSNILKLINQKPDVIICHLYNSYLTFGFLKKHFNVPFVIGIHGSDVRLAKSGIHRLRIKRILKITDLIAYRSFAIKDNFEKHVKVDSQFKTFIAHSGIPEKLIEKAQGLKNNFQEKQFINFKIISVCRLIKLKQIDKVILVLKEIKAQGINFEYTIIGKGPEKENLMNLAKKLNLENQVQFLGHIPREQVFKYMSLSDIFIMPSYKETLGLVYLEAMANGCIIIGAKGWGIDGIVKNKENGFLCDPYNPDAINECTNFVLTQKIENLNKIRKNSLNTIVNYREDFMAETYRKKL